MASIYDIKPQFQALLRPLTNKLASRSLVKELLAWQQEEFLRALTDEINALAAEGKFPSRE